MSVLLPDDDVDGPFQGLCATLVQREKGIGALFLKRAARCATSLTKAAAIVPTRTATRITRPIATTRRPFLVIEGGSQISASLNPVRIEVADHKAVPASGTRNLRESCLVHQIGQGNLLREVNLESV
ncbi:hypothetical protein [Blastomonas fulva]|uniref:Uncharacterized protein n=1 Tax=Blastomonas fulva TaxID=1550728 RepID=A0ABM6MCP7_9SPHN|nr:hypothetical protein [Blastomonas fulva]ASR53794.1 hypothetical protein B5J99_19410 [Blastomonas fulva]